MDEPLNVWNIIDTYFRDNIYYKTQHHIDSFNEFIFSKKNGIRHIIKRQNPLLIYKEEKENSFLYEIKIYFGETIEDDASSVNYKLDQGYNPEAVYDNLGSRYFILCIDDFNKNYSNTLSSPFTESIFNNETAIAKVPNNPNSINFDDIFYQSRRNYFGPVNIKKIKIQLLDELGRVVDLNNNDFSFSIQIEQLYDAHLNKMYN